MRGSRREAAVHTYRVSSKYASTFPAPLRHAPPLWQLGCYHTSAPIRAPVQDHRRPWHAPLRGEEENVQDVGVVRLMPMASTSTSRSITCGQRLPHPQPSHPPTPCPRRCTGLSASSSSSHRANTARSSALAIHSMHCHAKPGWLGTYTVKGGSQGIKMQKPARIATLTMQNEQRWAVTTAVHVDARSGYRHVFFCPVSRRHAQLLSAARYADFLPTRTA